MSADVVRFGDGFEVDRIAYQVRRSGRALRLERIPMETLLLLVERRGRLVSREEIIERIWGKDVFLDTDNSINSAIRKIRQALKDNPEDPRFIQTVTGKGYRFIAAVTEVGTPDIPEVAAISAVAPRHDNAPLTAAPPSAPPTVQGHSGRNRTRILVILACILAPLAVLYWMHAARRMNASGASRTGPATGVRMLPLLSLRGQVHNVALSPDSKEIAFVWDGENAVHGDVYVHLIGGDAPQRITQTKSGFTCCVNWSPDGHQLAFARCEDAGGGVYIVPALGGTERKVTSVPCVYGHAGWPVWTADGQSLVIADQCSPRAPTSIVLLSLNTGEKRCLTQPEAGNRGDLYPTLSPDGSTIAFLRERSEICTVSPSGGTTRLITSDVGIGGLLMWSNDGKQIIFRSSRSGLNRLWRVSRDGGPIEPETEYPEVGSQSYDGSRLAYVLNPGILPTELMRATVRAPGGPAIESHLLIASGTTNGGVQPSPDGRFLAFESSVAQDAGWTMEVWKSRSDGSDPVQMTSFHGHAGTPRWSPDGEWIAFDYRPFRSRLYVMNSEGRNVRMVTDDSFEQVVPSWSRDGKSVYFASNRTGEWQVWRRELNSARESQITHHGGFAAFESDDGKTVYYSRCDANGIWSVGVDGGPEVQLTDRLHRGYWGHFAVTASGLYFLDSDAKEGPTIMFLDLESHHAVPVLTLEKNPYPWHASLAASRDGLTLYWTQYELTSSIALATNFR